MHDNDNYIHDLNQIRERQLATLDEIDQIKDRYTGATLDEIEWIQNHNLKVLFEIDEIRKRREDNFHDLSETGQEGTANPC